MPKVKVKSGAKKRFKLTGSGLIKRKQAYKRHILTKKTTKQKRSLSGYVLISPADEDRVRTMLQI